MHGTGPLLIIAGAGTGKTTVITERIKHLILENHIPPSKILALTFTEKAAEEMQERVDIALPYGYADVWIDTFHAFCDRVLKQEAIHIGLSPDYKLTTEAESVLFLRKNLFKLDLEYFRPLGNPNKFLQGLIQHFGRLKDEDITPENYINYAQNLPIEEGVARLGDPQKLSAENNVNDAIFGGEERQDPYILQEEHKKTLELANAYKVYETLKIQEGIMDFSDLIYFTLKLFRERKSILKRYVNKFEYILIDEFQDTNFAQNQLTLLLAGEKQNITVVGDDDQAIYRWRGAALSNMIQFRTSFPTAKIITLTQNYRSKQTILDTAYELIQHNNPDRLEIKEKIDKKLIASTKKMGEEVELILSDTGDNEAEQVVKKIEELVEKRKYSYGDFAILVRANDHAQPFIQAFQSSRIPHQFLGPTHLFHQEEIKDLIAYLKILCNQDDSTSLYRILTMPIFQVHPLTVSTLLNTGKRRNLTLFETLSTLDSMAITDEEKQKIQNIVLMIQRHLGLISKETAAQIIFAFLQDTGQFKKLLEPEDALSQLQAQNVTRFFEKLKTYESERNTTSVFDVVEWIDLSMQMGESPQASTVDVVDTNAVSILTIHSSKGLEFPVVFVVNMVRDRFPSRQRPEQIPIPGDLVKEVVPEGDYHLAEERRLFYVAITRAKEKVFFTASKFYGEAKREKKLSPFIAESVGEKLIKTVKKNQNLATGQLSLLELFSAKSTSAKIVPLPIDHKAVTKVTYLSYSQIQTFETCPLHYKLRYIMKIPTPQTSAQAFGTSVHACLRDFYQRKTAGEKVAISDIQTILERVWTPEGYQSREHEKRAFAKAVTIIEEHVTGEFSTNPKPIALELPFEFFINKLRIGGRIDRIDELPNGAIEIIDYKTGTNIPTEKELAKNLQLTTYALAAVTMKDNNFQRNSDEILLSLYYLEKGKKLTTTRTPEQLEEAKQELLLAAETIEQSDFSCSGSIFCQNCEYKMLCKKN